LAIVAPQSSRFTRARSAATVRSLPLRKPELRYIGIANMTGAAISALQTDQIRPQARQ
jgi:hypothetical protein